MKYCLIAFFLAFVLVSCNKTSKYFDVDADIVTAFTYPEGSYWIFKDSATGALDSLAMRSFSTETDVIGMDYRSTTTATWHFTELHEYQDGIDTAQWQFQMLNDGEHNWVSQVIKYDPYRASVLLKAYPVFARPGTGLYTNVLANETNELELLPSMTVNGQRFDSVYHTRYFSKTNQPDEHFYLNLKVGIIKYVQHSLGFHRTLELVRWHVPR